ncbi:MAG: hypothetical protein ACWA41_07560 [Putridiphycobacter sp.]
MIQRLLLIFNLLFFSGVMAQQGETIFGFQYKPIIPNKYIGEYERSFDSTDVFYAKTKQKFGHSMGMVFRHYFLDKVAIESGINFTKRNFSLHYEVPDSNFIADTSVAFINYQIPVKGVFFVQLSDEIFMNASLGLNFDFFPSFVGTNYVVNISNQFGFIGARTNWVQIGANANYGFEYRTKKKGAFYFGATYNQPFGNIMQFNMAWKYDAVSTQLRQFVKGSYLTVDFRYYLPLSKD